jgi:hypothetical protein
VVTPDESVTIPDSWTPTVLTLDGKKLPAWKTSQLTESVYLVYLMDSNGNQSFYRYDTQSQMLLPYDIEEVKETKPTEAITPSMAPEPSEEPEPAKANPWALATAVMGLICLALVGVLIWQGSRGRRDIGEDDDQVLPPPPIKRI